MSPDTQPAAPELQHYICLGYFDREAMDRLPAQELQGILSRCTPHLRSLYASQRVVLDAGLASQAWWVQRMNQALAFTDGPFAETKECVGSVLLIEAQDDAEALRIAALHPSMQLPEGERLGWRMEVRRAHYVHAPRLLPARGAG